MIEQIETKIIERLQARWATNGGATALAMFDVGKDFEDVLTNAALSIATEKIGFSRKSEGFEVKIQIAVYVCFKDVGSSKGRRTGVYPMVLGTVAILAGQDLGLEDIDELVPDGSAVEVFHENLKKRGMVGFRIPFTTAFVIDRLLDDATITKLLSEGISYHLDGNATTDAHDEVTYPEEE